MRTKAIQKLAEQALNAQLWCISEMQPALKANRRTISNERQQLTNTSALPEAARLLRLGICYLQQRCKKLAPP